MAQLSNPFFSIGINPARGSLETVILKQDSVHMNWLPKEASWLPMDKQWGLGFVVSSGHKYNWKSVLSIRNDDGQIECRYRLEASDGISALTQGLDHLSIIVTRTLKQDMLEERFVFHNEAEHFVCLDELGLYSTFYDEYPVVVDDILSRRAHMHIWPGGGVSYIKAVRMSGLAPHLAMISEAGEAHEYHIEDKNSSNYRGVVAMVSRRVRIASGASHVINRVIASYEDEASFHRLVTERTGYPYLEFSTLAAPVGESIEITVKDRGRMERLTVMGCEHQLIDGERLTLRIERPGELRGSVHFNGRIADICLMGLPPVEELLYKRAEFIVQKQQLQEKADPRNGAFLPYNRERGRQIKVEEIESVYGSIPDYNDARERLGMGAFLAELYRLFPAFANTQSLTSFYRFVKRELISEDYRIWDSCFREQTARYYGPEDKDMTFRGYNYFFVTAFLINFYRLTGEQEALDDVCGILRKYFEKFPLTDLAFGIDPNEIVQALLEAGREADASELTERFTAKARAFLRMGDKYEPSEVNYEQSTVAGVTMFLFDAYRLTGEVELLEAGRSQLRLLERFDGCQPDYHMHSVGLRHWDGYWFGQYELWGDTLPHHWSTLSAYAYYRYYEISGDLSYRDKAHTCLNANLSLFMETGEANNTFIYPHRTNGLQGHLYDPICNDQDWALNLYLKITHGSRP